MFDHQNRTEERLKRFLEGEKAVQTYGSLQDVIKLGGMLPEWCKACKVMEESNEELAIILYSDPLAAKCDFQMDIIHWSTVLFLFQSTFPRKQHAAYLFAHVKGSSSRAICFFKHIMTLPIENIVLHQPFQEHRRTCWLKSPTISVFNVLLYLLKPFFWKGWQLFRSLESNWHYWQWQRFGSAQCLGLLDFPKQRHSARNKNTLRDVVYCIHWA